MRDVVDVGLEAEHHDGGVGGVDLAVAGVGGQVGGQVAARGVDAGFDVARGAVDVAVEIELQNVTLVVDSEEEEVISVTPAMCPNWRSSGVATEEAMMSGLAPGSEAATAMVGKSTCGSGRNGQHGEGDGAGDGDAMVSSVVATGRSIKTREGFMGLP